MKKLFIITSFLLLLGSTSFGQILQRKIVQNKSITATQAVKVSPTKNSSPQTPPPKPTDLQKADINLVSGENGKSSNTILTIEIYDSKQLKAAGYTDVGLTQQVEDDRVRGHIRYIQFVPIFEPGAEVSLSAQLDASEIIAVELNGIVPYSITRNARFSDFANGGSISISINPKTWYPLIGPDTWKINSFTVYLSFDNDPTSPHKMTWNGFTLSLTTLTRTLKFDKNFNPIQ